MPVDVQALVVRAGANDTEAMVRLPWRDGQTEPAPAGRARRRHAACRRASTCSGRLRLRSGRGTLRRRPGRTGRRVSPSPRNCPCCPTGGPFVRLAVPSGARDPMVTGWVLEADTGTVTAADRLAHRHGDVVGRRGAGRAADRPRRRRVVGAVATTRRSAGSASTTTWPTWPGLRSRATRSPTSSPAGGRDSADDPLDGVGTDVGYRQRLQDLGWNDPDHPSPDADQRAAADKRYRRGRDVRPGRDPALHPAAAARLRQGGAVGHPVRRGVTRSRRRSARPSAASSRTSVAAAALPPAPTRTTLLHGRIHGVPLPRARSRPTAARRRTACGSCSAARPPTWPPP